jgi:hypothetical protein
VLTASRSRFDLFPSTDYIDPLVKSHAKDVIFNVVIEDTISRKLSNEPWRGAKEKSHVLMEIMLETCSPPKG